MQDGAGYWRGRQQRLSRRLFVVGGCGGLAATLTLAACGGSGGRKQQRQANAGPSGAQSAEPPRAGGVINYYLPGNPPTFDPHRSPSALAMQPCGAVYSRLFRFKATHDPQVAESKEPENDLAVNAESPDGITWTIKLRPDARFHDVAPVNGHRVEAEDVRATFTRAVDPRNPNGGSLDMIDANAIETPSNDTVVFRLRYPFAALPSMLAVALYGWILPREAVGGAFDPGKQMIGSGPFLFDSYTPDVAVTFKKNPDWFEKGRPYVDGVRLAIIPDAAQRLAQFSAGNLDRLEPAANDVDTARRSNPKAEVITGAPDSINRLVGKLGDSTSPWTDIRVRRAFSMAIDRAAIGASVLGGKFENQALLPLSLGKWALRPSDLDSTLAQVYKYDPAQAKQLLNAAGIANLTFKFVYTSGYPEPYETLSQAANSMLNAIGVKTNIVVADYNSEYINGGKGYANGYYDGTDTLVVGATGGTYTTIDEILYAYYDSNSRKLPTRLKEPTVDSMIDKARGTLDETERLKAYQNLQKYLIDKSYYVTGWPWQLTFTMVQPWVREFSYTQGYGYPTESFAKLWLSKR